MSKLTLETVFIFFSYVNDVKAIIFQHDILKCARRPAVQIQMFQIKQTFIRFFFPSLLNVHYQNVYRLFSWSQSETHDTFIQKTHVSASVSERCLQRIMLHWPNK